MSYLDSLAWLYATQLTGIKLGLDVVRQLLRTLEIDFDAHGIRVIHVAGTNGKGSVCAMIDAVCRAQGYRSGLFTSPHLVSFRERIRLDGRPIPETAVAERLSRLREIAETMLTAPTFFELTTALALDWFQSQRADVVILETGLGGRLDATNAMTPRVSVITALDFDHTAWLGDTLAEIAGEKAGIIKAGVPVVSAPQASEAADVIERVAQEQGSALRVVAQPIAAEWTLGLVGSHQRLNAALALEALDAAGIEASEAARRDGLAGVNWPGRFQRLEQGRVVLDGAHNPAAARRLAHTWHEEYGDRHQATVVLGILRDKDIGGICRALAPLAARFITVPTRSPRSASATDLLEALAVAAPGVPAHVAEDVRTALADAAQSGGPVLVTGSLFLVGEALALITGQEAPEASWQ